MAKNNPRIKELLSAQEASILLKTSIANIYYWMDEDKLSTVMRGKLKMVYRKEIVAMKDSR